MKEVTSFKGGFFSPSLPGKINCTSSIASMEFTQLPHPTPHDYNHDCNHIQNKRSFLFFLFLSKTSTTRTQSTGKE